MVNFTGAIILANLVLTIGGYEFSFNCGMNNLEDQRVLRGQQAKKGEIPWQALLWIKQFGLSDLSRCGGVVITDQIILTAAHCIDGLPHTEYIQVVLGAYDLTVSGDELILNSTQFAIHPQYGKQTKYDYDAGVIFLKDPIPWSRYPNIRPVCLPPRGDVTGFAGKPAVVSGWGVTSEGRLSTLLNKATVSILPEERCNNEHVYGKKFTRNMLCAGAENNADACQGDSGGPLASSYRTGRHFELVGIISWARGCGNPGFPGVYTSLASIYSWLKNILENNISSFFPTGNVRNVTGSLEFYDFNNVLPTNYTGELLNGIREGQGTALFPNGDIYEGEWHENKMTGYGQYSWGTESNWAGDVYTGNLYENKRSGYGVYRYGEGRPEYAGDIYRGEYKDDAAEGFGIYREPDGNGYEGMWSKGLKHGKGKEFRDGYTYEGEFQFGEMLGNHTITHPDGQVTYDLFIPEANKQELKDKLTQLYGLLLQYQKTINNGQTQ